MFQSRPSVSCWSISGALQDVTALIAICSKLLVHLVFLFSLLQVRNLSSSPFTFLWMGDQCIFKNT